jgi:hypothetical protein
VGEDEAGQVGAAGGFVQETAWVVGLVGGGGGLRLEWLGVGGT